MQTRAEHCAPAEKPGPFDEEPWERTTRVWDKEQLWRDCEADADRLYLWVWQVSGVRVPAATAEKEADRVRALTRQIARVWFHRFSEYLEGGLDGLAVHELHSLLRLGTLLGAAGGGPGAMTWVHVGLAETLEILGRHGSRLDAALWTPLLEELRLRNVIEVGSRRLALVDECLHSERVHQKLGAAMRRPVLELVGEPVFGFFTAPVYSPYKLQALTRKRCREWLGSFDAHRTEWLPRPADRTWELWLPGAPWVDNAFGRFVAEGVGQPFYGSGGSTSLESIDGQEAVLGTGMETLQAEAIGVELPAPWLDPSDGRPIDWDPGSRTLRARPVHDASGLQRVTAELVVPSLGGSPR